MFITVLMFRVVRKVCKKQPKSKEQFGKSFRKSDERTDQDHLQRLMDNLHLCRQDQNL